MAVNLNLLPPELSVSKSLGRVLKTIRMFGVIFAAVFVILVVAIVALFIVSNITLSGLKSSGIQLQSQVKAQEQSEQQLVLVKDRISKIRSVQSKTSPIKNFSDANSLLGTLSVGTNLTEMDVDTGKVSLDLNFKNNSDLTRFLASISSTTIYNSVVLSSFSLNPVTGYTLSLDLTKK